MKRIICLFLLVSVVFLYGCTVKIEDPIPVPVEVKKTVNLTLYFPDENAIELLTEQRSVNLDGRSLEEAVLEELFKGPVSENLTPSLEGENLVISAKTDESGLCTVDFEEEFVYLNSGGTTRETMAVGSIVNSLCEIGGIECVKINIEGNEKSDFGGHFTLEAPFYPSISDPQNP